MLWTNQMVEDGPIPSRDTRVILVRHGQSTFNAEGRCQGSSDASVLTAVGRQAAHQTGRFLRGLPVDALYTSPLQRAQETASAILAVMAPAINPEAIYVAPQLREIDLPLWQGLPHQTIQEQFSEDYRYWKQRPDQFQMLTTAGSCFPVLELYDRLRHFWQSVLTHHRGQTLIIVSHGGSNRALISTALGISPAYYHRLQQSNCGISVLRFSGGYLRQAHLEALNWTGHLGETLPPPKGETQGLRLLLLPTPIPPEQVQRVAHLLQDLPIQLSLCDPGREVGAIAEQILHTHPETVHLQVWRRDFPELWQQAIATRSRVEAESTLVTGLVIADLVMLRRFVAKVCGLSAYQSDRLQLQSGTLSVLHYPAAATQPLFQAMNLPDQPATASAVVAQTALAP